MEDVDKDSLLVSACVFGNCLIEEKLCCVTARL